MRITRRLAVSAAAVSLVALGATACGGGGSSGGIGKSNSTPTGHKLKGGTVSLGWPATPNFIFPLTPATNSDGFNANLSDLMWPNLVYAGDGGQSIVNPKESLYSSLTYSNNDKTITIVLKPWKWSDGQPITSRDFLFTYNLLKPKPDYSNWIDYISGLFPKDVSSVSAPSTSTVVINLTRSYNPEFYTDDVLSEVPLLPQHAWDKTSATGKVGNYDETASGAQAVYAFLQKEGGQMSSFTTNPLWKVVDGPFKLSLFDPSSGLYDYVPNTGYSGPDKPTLSKVVNEPFTTDTAMLEALRAGTLDIGNLPQNDLGQSNVLKAAGYSLANQYVPGVAAILPNLVNTKTGPLVQQLYIRQAMEYLINRSQIVSKVYAGYADPGNGPVPLVMVVIGGEGRWRLPLLAVQGHRAAQGARLDCQARRGVHLPEPGHRALRLRRRDHQGRAAELHADLLLRQLDHGRAGSGHPVLGGAGRRGPHAEVRAVQHDRRLGRHLHRCLAPELDLQLAAGGLRLRPLRTGPGRGGLLQHRRRQQHGRLLQPRDGQSYQRHRVRLQLRGLRPVRELRHPAAALAVGAQPIVHPGVQEQPGGLRAAEPVLRRPQPAGLVLHLGQMTGAHR
jgi:ABC-type oligopeptide transport system substrate-binding subunit